jgi:hypothetical protein
MKITDGIDIRDFWSILRDGALDMFSIRLARVSGGRRFDGKLKRVEKSISFGRYCICLIRRRPRLSVPLPHLMCLALESWHGLKLHLTKNIEFLIKEGFLPLRNPVLQPDSGFGEKHLVSLDIFPEVLLDADVNVSM